MPKLIDIYRSFSLITLFAASCGPSTASENNAPKNCTDYNKTDIAFVNTMIETSSGATITSEPTVTSLPDNCVLIIVNHLAASSSELAQVTYLGIERNKLDGNGTAINMACGNLDPLAILGNYAPNHHPEVKRDCYTQNTNPTAKANIAGIESPVSILPIKNQAIFNIDAGTNLLSSSTNLRPESRMTLDQIIARTTTNYLATLGYDLNRLTFHRIDTDSHVAPDEQFQRELLPHLPTLVPPSPTLAAPIYTQTPTSPPESSPQNISPEQLQLTEIIRQPIPEVHEVRLRITLGEGDRDLYAFMLHPDSVDGNLIRVQSVRNDRVVLDSIEELLKHAQNEQNKNEIRNFFRAKAFEVPSVASDITFSNTTLDHIVLFSLNLPGGEKGYVTVDASTLTDPTLTLPVPLYYIKIDNRHSDNASLVALDANSNEISSATKSLNDAQSWDLEKNTSKYNGAYVFPSDYLTHAQSISEPSRMPATVKAISELQQTVRGFIVGTDGFLHEADIPVGIFITKPSNDSVKTGPENIYGTLPLSFGMSGLPKFISDSTIAAFDNSIRKVFGGVLPTQLEIVIPLTNALVAPFPEEKESSLLPQDITPSAYLIQQPLLSWLDPSSIVEIREADKPKLNGMQQIKKNRRTIADISDKSASSTYHVMQQNKRVKVMARQSKFS